MNLLMIAIILVLIEACLYLIVSLQRRSFPWLITKRDELPIFDSQALKKFIDYSFDPHLGWVRRPNSTGIENGIKGPITFHIDSLGSRSHSYENGPPVIAAFGDSYTFCRQVEDDETWEAQLSKKDGIGVLNFGVGNYGVDQALLRYESMILPDTVRVVVMGFVPETICRIQSYWKHYLEFGNTFAFKPRFKIDSSGRLTLLENLIRSTEDYASIREKLPAIRDADAFYEKKFRSQQFRFPYIFSLMRHPLKHSLLISVIAARGMLRSLGISNHRSENMPFTLVMKNNLRDAHRLYGDIKSTALLSAVFMRFKNEAERRGHIPLIVVMPQLLDLKINNAEISPYHDYFYRLSKQISLLDLTKQFCGAEVEKLYINDQYGGHLSACGNSFVANEISNWLKLEGNTELQERNKI